MDARVHRHGTLLYAAPYIIIGNLLKIAVDCVEISRYGRYNYLPGITVKKVINLHQPDRNYDCRSLLPDCVITLQ